jgi:hypothetical protein
MLENSTRARSKVKGSSSGKMAHFMRETLPTGSSLALASTISQISINSTMVNFASARWKDEVLKLGQMVVVTKEILNMVKKTARAPSTGRAARPI